MSKPNILKVLLGVLISVSIVPSISCQQNSWSLIIPIAQFQETPWSDFTSAKFSTGIGLERSITEKLSLRGVGWIRNGNMNVGPSSGNMKGVSFKLSTLYSIVNQSRFSLKTGIGYNFRKITVADGTNNFHGTPIANSVWKRNSIFNSGEILLELEIFILDNLSIFANSGAQVGHFNREDSRFGDTRGVALNFPFLDLVGIKFKM